MSLSSSGIKIIFLVLLTSLSAFCSVAADLPSKQEVKPPLSWATEEGMKRFLRAEKTDFYLLANHFESQSNGMFCGPASAVIVLNALRLGRAEGGKKPPKDFSVLSSTERRYLPEGYDATFEKYTQKNIFELGEKGGKSRLEVLGKPKKQPSPVGKDVSKNRSTTNQAVKDFGFQIRQLDAFLDAHGLASELRVVNEQSSVAEIKAEMIKNLQRAGDYVLVNYQRKALGQDGGGHISPLGAYDEKSDSFLIMDVNPNKAPWVWVSSEALIQAMKTFDTVENRGYLLVADQ